MRGGDLQQDWEGYSGVESRRRCAAGEFLTLHPY